MSDRDTEKELEGLSEIIMSERIYEPEKAMISGKRMLELADRLDSRDRYFGIAYYCMADSSLALNRKRDFDKFIVSAIAHAQSAGDRPILVRCYNLIAIDTVTQGNYPMALDNYLKALEFSESKQSYEAGLIYSNVGELYSMIGEYSKSVRYYKTGLRCFEISQETEFRNSNICICYVEIARDYYLMSELDEAHTYIKLLENMCSGHHEYMYNVLAILSTQAIIYHAIGETEKSDGIIKKIIEGINKGGIAIDTFVELLNLTEFLEESGKSEEFEKLAGVLVDSAEKTASVNIQLKIVQLQLKHAEKKGDKSERDKYLDVFYRIYMSQQEEARSIDRNAVDLRQALAEAEQKRATIEEQNRILTKRSMMDALTGLPNRFALNEYSEKAFEKAVSYGTPFAIEMLDIDCFKELNDTFGHQQGDVCLQTLAGILESIAGKGVFVSRFGGDEFVVIYEGKNDEEILQYAEGIRQKVIAADIKNPNSGVEPYMTVTQGIMNSMPDASDKVWNYLYGADNALYEAKRAGKDTVRLVHRLHRPEKGLYE